MSFKAFKRPALVSLGLVASAAFTACDNTQYVEIRSTAAQNAASAKIEEENRQAAALYAGSQKKIFAITYMDHKNDGRGSSQVVPSICFTDSAAVAADAKSGNISTSCLESFTINSRQGATDLYRGKPYATLARKLEQAVQIYKGTYKGDAPVTRFPHVTETTVHVEKSEGMEALIFLPEYDLACNAKLGGYQAIISEDGSLSPSRRDLSGKKNISDNYLYVDKTTVSVSNCEDVPTGDNFAYQARMKYLKAQPE